MRRLFVPAIQIAVLIAGAATPAQAQIDPSPVRRPIRGLFGGVDESAGTPSADFTLVWHGAVEGVDSPDQTELATDPAFRRRFHYSGLLTAVSLDRPGRRLAFGLRTASAFRYYDQSSGVEFVNQNAHVAVSTTIGRKARLAADFSGAYSPFYSLSLLPNLPTSDLDGGALVGVAQSVTRRQVYSYGASISLNRPVRRRGGFEVAYGYLHSDFSDGSAPNIAAHHARMGLAYRLTKNAGLRLGYGYRFFGGSLSLRDLVRTHDVDIGLDYNRALSFSRRTTIRFSSGSTVVSYGGVRFYRVIGGTSLNHEIGRTWNARVEYSRHVQVFEAFAKPVLADGVRVGASGLVGRRVAVAVSAGYGNGDVGLQEAGSGFLTYSGSARLDFRLGRATGLQAEYFYHQYDIDSGAPFLLGSLRRLDRQGLRAGLALGLPLWRAAKR